jgi:mono/diheme cytochrome c family protein
MVRPMNAHMAVRAFRARPVAALAAVIVTVASANALLVGCGGGQQQSNEGTQTTTQTTPPAETPSATATTASVEVGQRVYTERCVLCHGASGKGDGVGAAGLDPKPRDHTDGSYMNTQTDEALLNVIKNGKGNMPAWGNVLSEVESQSVLMYVRTLAVPPYPGN